MNKVYVVTEFGGEWEDKWEHTAAVCETPELAEALRKKILEKHNPENCPISAERWDEMIDKLWEYEDETNAEFNSDIEGLLKLFPMYTKEELELAELNYSTWDDWAGVDIHDIPFIKSEEELSELNC